MNLSTSSKINEALDHMGFREESDLLYHLPRSYMDFSITPGHPFSHKEKVVLLGKVVSNPTFTKTRKLSIVHFAFISDNNDFFKVVAFNRPYLLKMLNFTDQYTLVGIYDEEKRQINLVNILKGVMDEKLRPIYSLPRDIENHTFLRLVTKTLSKYEGRLEDVIPLELMDKYQLLTKWEALRRVHNPQTMKDVYQGLRTLKFEECLLFSLQTQLVRRANKICVTNKKDAIPTMRINEFIKSLAFKLTHDQVLAVKDIITDMNSEMAMYRLLQGDVGTGKTLVGAIAIYGAYLRHEQSALMAPTDALAKQHLKSLNALFKGQLRVGLLVGSLTAKERASVLKALKNHQIDVIVGTHALFSPDVVYASLGFAIVDEQHKFGVNQRLFLSKKGEHTDLLLMSATPIPRTLAMTVYGDLDVTTLTQFPHGQHDIQTSIVPEDDGLIPELIKASLANHRRIFIVAPLITYEEKRDSVEKLFVQYQKLYPNLVGLLHGELSSENKDAVLDKFYDGEKPILISTSVIEVGIDVAEANLIIIYGASCFGLSALHQLRGRVGRDGTLAHCLLINDEEEENEKLKVLENSNDGFVIAEADLKLRGPGEVAGTRQSGLPSFTYVNLIDDYKMFLVAREEAEKLLKRPDVDRLKVFIEAQKRTQDNKFVNV